MAHECTKETEIATMKAEIQQLKRNDTDAAGWRVRMEEKMDKMLWFLLGNSVSLILCVAGGVIVYAITR